MIGDGINDASALAVAHVGIALSSGTDLANSAATATLYHGDLRVVPWAIALSREAVRTVRRNLWRAAGYNVLGITLAAFGVLHPVVAALLMVVSSLLVAWSSVRVGISAETGGCDGPACRSPAPSAKPAGVSARATIHGMAFALQALVVLLLINLSTSTALVVVLAFALLGWLSARAWLRESALPHWLDMTYGMLTLGNLGMLLGWWADNGCTRLHDAGCCACVDAMRAGLFKPWMWLGMLLFANLAMAFLARRPHPELRWCRTAMFTGGNLAMAGGMLLGGWLASQAATESVNLGALSSFLGMTLGMVAGMLLGTDLTRRLIGLAARMGELFHIRRSRGIQTSQRCNIKCQ